MAVTEERLTAVLEARVDKLERAMSTAERASKKAFDAINTGADGMADRVNAAAARTSNGLDKVAKSTAAAAFQQRNLQMQMADVGQSLALGMSPLQVLLQQGPQLAQIYGPGEGGIARAFREAASMVATLVVRLAPLAGVLAAGYGAYKLLQSNSAAAAVSIGDATKALADQAAPIGQIKGAIEDLQKAQNAYADAIEKSGPAQVSASNTIIAATQKEFEAKRSLLELELKRQQAALLVQRSELAQKQIALKTDISQQVFTRIDTDRTGYSDPKVGPLVRLPDDITGLQKTIDAIDANPLTDEIKELRANIDIAEVSTGKLDEALKLAFKGGRVEIEKASDSASKAGRSIASAGDQGKDAWEGLRQVSESVREQMAANAAAAEALREQLAFPKETVTSALSDIRRGFMEGKTAAEVFGNAAVNVFDKIASKAEGLLVDSIFDSLFSGGFNLLGAGAATAGSVGGGIPAALGAQTARTSLSAAVAPAVDTNAGSLARMASSGALAKVARQTDLRSAEAGVYRPSDVTHVMGGRTPAGGVAGIARPEPAGQSVHVTFGFAEDAAGNIVPKITEISRREIAAQSPGIVRAGIETYRKGLLHDDIARHAQRPRVRGK